MQYVNQFSLYQSKPERNIRDVNEAKATRRAEIERRCAALENPLLPSVLRHMESFQAAMQISQPMTDQAWQILKPRLLAQLPYAERREKELIQQTELLAEEYKQRRQQEAQLKETKENFDREWETFQAPVRKRIGAYADEIIESTWAGGKSVTKEISPKFAADVLLHVRQRFYSATAQEDKAALAAGDPVKTDLPNGPPTRKLMLENMKWVFDSKIKPLTDHFQRELFLCNGCDGNYKFYGFEGVIQHYAAKHTTTLSMGNIVVHWRSEWPEHPPFNPNPSIAKAAYYKVPTPAPPFLPVSSKTPHGTMSYGNRNQGAEAVISGESRQHTTPSYSADGYPTAYKAHHQGATPQSLATQAFPPPSTIHGVSTGYSGAQHEFVANSAITYNLAAAQHEGQIPQHGSSYPSQHAYPSYSQETPGTKFQAYLPGPTTNAYGIHPAASYPLHFSNAPLASHPPAAHNVSGPVSDLYQRQMEEMAKHAKDVFTGIGGVKDLPGSVRIFVVIQHTVSRFKTTFPNEPSLSMFIDGLDHNAVMRPVRSVNGLGCRTCIKNGTGAKLFTLPHLVNHFRTAHVETAQTLGFSQIQELDWKHDMIDLPDVSVISKLIDAAGMTDSKLALLAFVFPAAFPSPLPNLRGRTHIGPQPTYKKELDQNTKSGVATNATSTCSQFEGKSGVQSLVQPYSDFRPLSRGPSEPLEPPGDDEYDPHRPMDLGKIVKIEPSHSQFRKFSKPSPQQDGNRQSLHIPQGTHRHSMHTRVVETRPYSEISSNEISEGYTGHHYGQKKQGTQPHSAVPDDLSRPVSLLVQRDGGHFRSSRQVDLTGYDDMEYPSISYRRTPNGSGLEVSRKTIGRRAQSLSPPEAVDSVDEILSTLPPRSEVGYSHEPYQLDREPERHSQDLWPSQTQLKRRPKYFGADGNCDQWLEAEDSIKRRGDDLDSDGARSGPLVPRNGSETVFPQRSGSYLQYYDDSLPVGQIHLRPIRADESPPVRYASYRNNDQIPGERQQREYSDLRRPRSGSHSYRMSRMPQYRNEVETSPEIPVETALYRPRSPVEEDRGGSVYHVRSPSRKGDHSQTIVSYPTHLRYEYVNDSVLSENHNQQRIEYLPVRYEDPRLREPTRYVLARPVQQVDVRYEHTYAPEPVYERSGQMYHAPTKAYQEPHSWEASSYTQSHQY